MSKPKSRPQQTPTPTPTAPPPPAAGRPPGTPNRDYDEVVAAPTACQRCSSTERSRYTHRQELEYAGEHDGRPFNRIVWRSCSCLACGQHRRDKFFELIEKESTASISGD